MFSKSSRVLSEDTDGALEKRGEGWAGLQTEADWTTSLLLSKQISQISCFTFSFFSGMSSSSGAEKVRESLTSRSPSPRPLNLSDF